MFLYAGLRSGEPEKTETGPVLADACVFLFLFLVVLFSHYPYWRQPHYWDALDAYFPATEGIFKGGLNPLLGGNKNIGHPPLVFWMTAAAWSIFGESLFASHLVIYFFGGILAFSTYLFGKRLVNFLFGICAGVLVQALPLVYAQTAQCLLDLPMAALILLAAYCLWREKWKLFLVAASLMVLTKAYAWAYLLPLWFFFPLSRLLEKRKAVPNLFLILPILVYPFYLFLVYWKTGTWIAGDLWKSAAPPMAGTLERILKSQRAVFNVIFMNSGLELMCLLAFLGIGVHFRRLNREKGDAKNTFKDLARSPVFPAVLLLLLISLFGYFIFLPMNYPNYRYYLPIYGPLLILGLYGGFHVFREKKREFVILCLCLAMIFVIRWHWSVPDRISRIFSRPVSRVVYRLLVYDDARDARPLSYSGEASLVYTDLLKVTKEAGAYIEKYYSDSPILCNFPLAGYFVYPVQGIVKKRFQVNGIQDPPIEKITKGTIFVHCSLYARRNPLMICRKVFNLKLLKRFERNNQWVEIYVIRGNNK